MSAKAYFASMALTAFAVSCGPSPAGDHPESMIYVDGRGQSAWVFTQEGADFEEETMRSDYVSFDRYIFREVKTNDGSCAFFDDNLIALGVPSNIQEGKVFECKTSSFTIQKCFDEDCRSSIISGEWRTGMAPDFRSVPFQFLYSRCLGITSISLTGFSDSPDYVGTSLDLRGSMGLLADLDGKNCEGNVIAGLF